MIELKYIKIYDGTTALHDSGSPGFFCGEIERNRLFISENSIVKLHFSADSYDDRFQFVVYTRQEQQQQLVERYGHHPSLYPHRRGQPITPGYDPPYSISRKFEGTLKVRSSPCLLHVHLIY